MCAFCIDNADVAALHTPAEIPGKLLHYWLANFLVITRLCVLVVSCNLFRVAAEYAFTSVKLQVQSRKW